MKDDLGNRMKEYELLETGRKFMRGLPIYARIDGKCFSKFTKGMTRPYDENMVKCMVEVTKYLVKNTNAILGYTQLDEISLFWNYNNFKSEMMFNGKIYKLTSVLAGMTSSKFVIEAMKYWPDKVGKLVPCFDCRIYQLPSLIEVANAFLWRNNDATKNAISMAASHYYSHKQLHGKTGDEKQEMLFQKGVNFDDYPYYFKRGTWVKRVLVEKKLSEEVLNKIPKDKIPDKVIRSEHISFDSPPMKKISNKVEFIMGEDPILNSEEK